MTREQNQAKRERKQRRDGKKPAPSSIPRWQIVENLVAAVERQWNDMPGATVTQKAMVSERMQSGTREVDILVSIPAGPRQFLLGVDVKHWKKRLDIEDLEQLGAKFASLSLDRYCVVSTSGFTERACRKAQSCNVELLTYEQVRHEGVFRELQTVMHYDSIRYTSWVAYWGTPEAQQPEEANRWNGVPSDQIILTVGDKKQSLTDMLTTLGQGVFRIIGRRKGDDAPTYEFATTFELNHDGLKALHGEAELPLPTGLIVQYVHERIEKRFDNLMFQTERAVAQATVVEDPFGNKLQLNVVATEKKGKLAVNISFAEAVPRRAST